MVQRLFLPLLSAHPAHGLPTPVLFILPVTPYTLSLTTLLTYESGSRQVLVARLPKTAVHGLREFRLLMQLAI